MNDHFRVMIPDSVFLELDAIFGFVSNDSPQNAESLLARLIADLHGLDFMPGRCPKAETKRFRGRAYRKLVSRPYLIYFRIDDVAKVVHVLTIRHGARKPL
ncbi:MAG: type II toxin-antitoxin system RelE/ParE family toxin [Burkholderiales bacterium]|nr:type II toxin-antitoxin system RelE/ParE family toxin [Phycisphaerae bacterium]